jgi:hypothetical protein
MVGELEAKSRISNMTTPIDSLQKKLPILDLCGFHVQEAPGQFFMVLDQQQSEKKEAALQKLLGVPKLIKEHYRRAKRLRPKLERKAAASTLQITGELYPVGRAADGNLIAVAVQLMSLACATENGLATSARRSNATENGLATSVRRSVTMICTGDSKTKYTNWASILTIGCTG